MFAQTTVGMSDHAQGKIAIRRAASRDVTRYIAIVLLTHALAHGGPSNAESPASAKDSEYRYRDSNPGFRRERALNSPAASGNVLHLHGELVRPPIDTAAKCTPDVGCEWAEQRRSGRRVSSGDQQPFGLKSWWAASGLTSW